ncbi:hypothetical protein [Candidatus Rariloculus sp.]|uniref:hypothetical protein n=1 Tax=Candidatus Rariloculus sp. TaxID=3101265 RepID=UPI003D0F1651
MSSEFWAIIGTGVTLGLGLGSLIIAQHAGIDSRLAQIESRAAQIELRLDSLHAEVSAIGQRVAYIEGRLEVQAPPEDSP